MPTLKEQIGIPLLVSRRLEPEIVESRKGEILACFSDLERVLGLKPEYFGVKAIHLHPSAPVHAIGEFDEWQIYLSSDLGAGRGTLFPGMFKANGGALRGVMRHELGHSIEGKFRSAVRGKGIKIDLERCRLESHPKQYLTLYADRDAHEHFAECFSIYAHPDYPRSGMRIHPDLLKGLEAVYPRRLA